MTARSRCRSSCWQGEKSSILDARFVQFFIEVKVAENLLPSDDQSRVVRKRTMGTMGIAKSKILGAVGALLMFIGVIPQISFFGGLPLFGLILVLVALWGLARYYKDAGIFNNALIGSIAGVVGIVVFIAIIVLAAVGFMRAVVPGWNGDWTSLPNTNPAEISANITLESIAPFLATFLIAIVILFLVSVSVAYFYRKSLTVLAQKTGVGMFQTTGTLLLIGAVFTIILVGLILIWIAVLLLAIAFFSIRIPQSQSPTVPQQQI